jgi:Fe-S cluster assembly ATP-binding protein
MGPNGSGKSTLAAIISGREEYEVTSGEVLYEGEDLLDDEPEERAHKGIFMAFQYPVELPGVSMTNFLKEAVNAIREERGQEPLSAAEFIKEMRAKSELVGLDADLTKRAVNEGFSGGEKKRNEIFQLAMLEPKLALLDETDSGLDIDALKNVSEGVNKLRSEDRGFLVITHYQRLLNYIVPDKVHVMVDGRIVRSGGKELALELEESGYEQFRKEAATAV